MPYDRTRLADAARSALYDLKHPVRALRYRRYLFKAAVAKRRRELEERWRRWRARRTMDASSREAARSILDRGEVIGRAVIGHDGDVHDLPREGHSGDWFERRSPLALEDPERRYAWR